MAFSPVFSYALRRIGRSTLPPESSPGAADFAFWDPDSFTFRKVFVDTLDAALVLPLCGQRWGQSRPKVPKRCQKGAQMLTFRSPKRRFWVP